MGTAIDVILFDLGGVLIEWNPRHLYRKLFAGDELAMESFLATVCTVEWGSHDTSGDRHQAVRPEAATRSRGTPETE